jgi:hypothetical protein
MSARLRVMSVVAAIACLAFAGSASAATEAFSGTVANGACTAARTVFASGPTRIEVSLSSTAQNPSDVLAEIVTSDGHVVGGGSYVTYDSQGSGQYNVRVCATHEEQNPPQIQFKGLLGTGPAGQRVLVSQADMGGVAGVMAYIGPNVTGKAAVRTRSGLAWFTVATKPNSMVTLRVFDPVHRATRVVKGLTATYTGNTLRITGHGLKLVLVQQNVGRVTFTSSMFKVRGKVVRGGFQITA